MLELFSYWVFAFFLFNIMGWILESTIESINHKRFLNRGFLFGPYIPIYGAGGVLFALIAKHFKSLHESIYINILFVFAVGMVLATILEYMVGSILERVFKKQFWDYSTLKLTNKFTYKNRISLVSSLFWGALSLFMAFFLYDIVEGFILFLPLPLMISVNVAMAAIMLTDTVIQVKRHVNIRKFLEKLSYEQLQEALLNNLLKIGNKRQIREFRSVLKNINTNLKTINNNINTNLKTINNNIKNSINDNIKKLNPERKKSEEIIEEEESQQ